MELPADVVKIGSSGGALERHRYRVFAPPKAWPEKSTLDRARVPATGMGIIPVPQMGK
jgi:hypothetical protein